MDELQHVRKCENEILLPENNCKIISLFWLVDTKIDAEASYFVILKINVHEAWLAHSTKAKSHHNHNRIKYKLNKHVILFIRWLILHFTQPLERA